MPGFGDVNGWLMILGLAPSLQGGNRTGRIFTGDKWAAFLMHALYKAGFANQPTSESRDDGLRLSGRYITAAVKCVPPAHKPTKEELIRCSALYLHQEFKILKNLKAILALGHFAFDAYIARAKSLSYS